MEGKTEKDWEEGMTEELKLGCAVSQMQEDRFHNVETCRHVSCDPTSSNEETI